MVEQHGSINPIDRGYIPFREEYRRLIDQSLQQAFEYSLSEEFQMQDGRKVTSAERQRYLESAALLYASVRKLKRDPIEII